MTASYTVTIDVFSLDYEIEAKNAKEAGEKALQKAFMRLSHNQEILEYEIGTIVCEKTGFEAFSLAEAEKEKKAE